MSKSIYFLVLISTMACAHGAPQAGDALGNIEAAASEQDRQTAKKARLLALRSCHQAATQAKSSDARQRHLLLSRCINQAAQGSK